MKPDISTSADIRLLIDTFYDKVQADPSIGFIFNDIAKVNWGAAAATIVGGRVVFVNDAVTGAERFR